MDIVLFSTHSSRGGSASNPYDQKTASSGAGSSRAPPAVYPGRPAIRTAHHEDGGDDGGPARVARSSRVLAGTWYDRAGTAVDCGRPAIRSADQESCAGIDT